MKKILIILVVMLALGVLGFTGYKFISSRFVTKNNIEPGVGAATLCDAIKHTCGEYSKTADSGTLKVMLIFGASPVGNLEVDVASKPGANPYYMKISDNSGKALFEGIPAGSYSVYFNGNNFPKKYGDAAVQQAQIVKGETKVIEIHLGQ